MLNKLLTAALLFGLASGLLAQEIKPASFQSQLGRPHEWTALQTFSGGISPTVAAATNTVTLTAGTGMGGGGTYQVGDAATQITFTASGTGIQVVVGGVGDPGSLTPSSALTLTFLADGTATATATATSNSISVTYSGIAHDHSGGDVGGGGSLAPINLRMPRDSTLANSADVRYNTVTGNFEYHTGAATAVWATRLGTTHGGSSTAVSKDDHAHSTFSGTSVTADEITGTVISYVTAVELGNTRIADSAGNLTATALTATSATATTITGTTINQGVNRVVDTITAGSGISVQKVGASYSITNTSTQDNVDIVTGLLTMTSPTTLTFVADGTAAVSATAIAANSFQLTVTGNDHDHSATGAQGGSSLRPVSVIANDVTATNIEYSGKIKLGSTTIADAAGNLTATNVVATPGTIGTVTGTNATVSNITATSLVATSATIGTLSGTNATVSNITGTAIVGTTINQGVNRVIDTVTPAGGMVMTKSGGTATITPTYSASIGGTVGLYTDLATPTATSINITCTQANLRNASGHGYTITPASGFVINTAAAGIGVVNGCEAVPVTNTWNYIFLISNGSTNGGFVSPSATAPALPTGYTWYLRTGSFRRGATEILRFYQVGDAISYDNYQDQLIVNNAQESTTWATADCSSFVPPTARRMYAYALYTPGLAGRNMRLRPLGSSSAVGEILVYGTTITTFTTFWAGITLNYAQKCEYNNSNSAAAGSFYLYSAGYQEQ